MTKYFKRIDLKTEAETLALGAGLAPNFRRGDVIALRGGLGVGKTALSRGIIRALTGEPEIPSPTYTLVQTYIAKNFDIWHFDLYRLDKEADIWELGIEDAVEDGLCLIEWPDRIENLLSGDELSINLSFEGEGRVAELSGSSAWEARLAKL